METCAVYATVGHLPVSLPLKTSYAVHRRLGDIRFFLVFYGSDFIANSGE
jgi:hypothetical protein